MIIFKALLNLLLWAVLLVILVLGSIPGFISALIYYSAENGWQWCKILLEHKLHLSPNQNSRDREFFKKLKELKKAKEAGDAGN